MGFAVRMIVEDYIAGKGVPLVVRAVAHAWETMHSPTGGAFRSYGAR